MVPPPSPELVSRLDRVLEHFSRGWVESVAARPDNPRGMVLREFGPVLAPAATAAPEVDFLNRVLGLGPDERPHLAAIIRHYRRLGVPAWFELSPLPGADELTNALVAAGARAGVSHAVLVHDLADRADLDTESAIEIAVVTPDQWEVFARVLLEGHEVPPADLDDAVADHEQWPSIPGWTLYLASLAGEPVGAGVLVVHDGIGYLANASTVPDARGQGVQTALIHRRLHDAAAAGCELATVGCTFLSPSHRNVARAGFTLSHIRASWRLA